MKLIFGRGEKFVSLSISMDIGSGELGFETMSRAHPLFIVVCENFTLDSSGFEKVGLPDCFEIQIWGNF